MLPGGSTPPAPIPVQPLGPASEKVFKPDLNRAPPVAESDLVPAGPLGFVRKYRVGNSRVSVPATEDEPDIVAGLNYLNNLREPDGAPLVPNGTFANSSTGDGVDAVDASGLVVSEGGSPKHYSSDYLRALGRLAREQSEVEPTGAHFKWRKPSEDANLAPDWFEAQKRFRKGDGSDAIIDPEAYGVADDAEDFADKAQRAANGEEGFSPKFRSAIKRAQETGEPQEVDILLPSSGPLYTARGEVLGLYAIRVRGVVVVKNGKYRIVGRAEVVDAGKFNYDYDGQKNRSLLAKFALGYVARKFPDPWDPEHVIADPGHDSSIRANRDADIAIWGIVQ